MNPEAATARAEKLRLAFKREGTKGYWQERSILDAELMKSSSHGISPVIMAMDAAMSGDKGAALHWLNEFYDAREGEELTLLAVDPAWDGLRDDPEFKALLRRIGLPAN